MVKIAIQGDKASFHDIAARQLFGNDSEREYCDTFETTINALKNDTADYALCAIENSLYGSINEVYDLLLKSGFSIQGETYLRIEQCLIALPGATLADITSIYSHPVALAQCEDFLDHSLPNAQRLEYHDTAASVEMVKERNDISVAAIASREAAELYGLNILGDSIETNKQNYTRFILIGKEAEEVSEKQNKTSLVIETGHTPGALYNALGSFAKRSINLTKIQSRPIIGKAWHYIFYIDVEVGINDNYYKKASAELIEQGCSVTVLGSYVSSPNNPV